MPVDRLSSEVQSRDTGAPGSHRNPMATAVDVDEPARARVAAPAGDPGFAPSISATVLGPSVIDPPVPNAAA